MQQDDVVWQVINDTFCSFKVKTDTATFCRNENSVTGLCNRNSCPLANSQYATVRELDGKLYLLKKTIERAHTPAKLWERILLSRDKEEALAKIECELQYWSPFLLDKCKLRLERLQEVQKQLHKILVRAKDQPLLTSKTNKVERRERSRENKARAAAKLELTIEKELVDRLRQGVYGDMYNLHQKAFESVLESHGKAMKLSENEDSNAEEEYEFVEGDDEELSDSCEYEFAAEEEAEVEEELHDIEEMPAAVKRKRSGPFVEIEYETEPAQVPHQRK